MAKARKTTRRRVKSPVYRALLRRRAFRKRKMSTRTVRAIAKSATKSVLRKQLETKWVNNTALTNIANGGTTVTYYLDMYPPVSQGAQKAQRIGNKIKVKHLRLNLTLANANVTNPSNWAYIYTRVILFKPKMFTTDADATTYMDQWFNNVPVYDMWAEPPWDYVNVHYDSGVQIIDPNRSNWSTTIHLKGHNVDYELDSDLYPNARIWRCCVITYGLNAYPDNLLYSNLYMSFQDG